MGWGGGGGGEGGGKDKASTTWLGMLRCHTEYLGSLGGFFTVAIFRTNGDT